MKQKYKGFKEKPEILKEKKIFKHQNTIIKLQNIC